MVSVPSIGGTFHSGRNFYSRQEGQLDFSKDSARISEEGERTLQRLEEFDGVVDDPKLEQARSVCVRETRKIVAEVPLHDAKYVERYSRLLPTWTVSEGSTDEEIVGRWLTGGVTIPATSFRRLSSLLGWLGKQDVADLVEAAGFSVPHGSGIARTRRRTHGQDPQSKRSQVAPRRPASDKEPSGTIPPRGSTCRGVQS